MAVHNKEIASKLSEVADILDIQGKNPFRVRSYRKAARVISGLSDNLEEKLDKDQKITDLPGIGDSMEEKIKEILDTGTLKQLEKLNRQIPHSLLEVMHLEQMGPQRTRILFDELHIKSLEDLRKAAEKGKVKEVEGFGEKTTEKILEEIKNHSRQPQKKRVNIGEVEELTEPLIKYLKKELENVTIAGSARRKKETVGDIDILATAEDPEKAMEYFTHFDEVDRVLSKGSTRSSLKLRSGLQVDLRIIKKQSYGAALLYFTGAKAHSIALRKLGQEKGYKVNEYGVFSGKKRLASKTEKAVYKKLGLQYIEPELREDRGEIEAAKKNQLPHLIKLSDIKGDLQTHTTASDGNDSLEKMVKSAEKIGYEYIAITDHSKRVTMAHGLDKKRISQQIRAIDRLNKKTRNIRILKSAEVDILKDGSLDLPDEILKELDLVVCSIHYNRNLSSEEQTRRILKAMDNPWFNILGHPTGRLVNKRKGYEVNMEKIMKGARERGIILEINASPDRLDLNDEFILMGREIGVKFSISTDAHSIRQLDTMKFGVSQARRGWLEKKDVVNTHKWSELKRILKRK